MSFSLRRAGAADAPAVCALFHKSFTATFGHLYPPQELAGFLAGCPVERFRAECTDPEFAVMLGEAADGTPLGYCTLGPYDLQGHIPELLEGRRWWVLRQLYLDEPAKGSGLADALMQWAVSEARARQVQDLYLTVWIENHRARRFYERHGFHEVGKYPYVVGNTVDDDRILRLTL
ncbi:GNAT family N-acetyltransferase [Sandaracinobacter neustonicus]|uniref:GNAT family N-acetyltransferase n=1 Tax=Sandaracinobacter neustonicus TaxID=1715348 RepID=A0A501XFY0_9SPHN|nr:GNAT family N-acetyltransferase [Sandaracinobacter neustonicus]TPE59446.1 GNAT family N-acetyltransferase [Sandaracinobacter neustonicus]